MARDVQVVCWMVVGANSSRKEDTSEFNAILLASVHRLSLLTVFTAVVLNVHYLFVACVSACVQRRPVHVRLLTEVRLVSEVDKRHLLRTGNGRVAVANSIVLACFCFLHKQVLDAPHTPLSSWSVMNYTYQYIVQCSVS